MAGYLVRTRDFVVGIALSTPPLKLLLLPSYWGLATKTNPTCKEEENMAFALALEMINIKEVEHARAAKNISKNRAEISRKEKALYLEFAMRGLLLVARMFHFSFVSLISV